MELWRRIGAGVAVPALALGFVMITRSGSEAAAASPVELTSATTTVAPAETTTTTAPAVVTTTTTTTPEAAMTTATTVVTSTRSAAVAPTRMEQVEAIADGTGFDWRAAGVTFHIAYHPEDCCHWGIYDYRDNSLWIGPSAFASQSRLRYVVLHELGHAWHWATGRRGLLAADMAPWGVTGNVALEYSADCIAAIWGATTSHYWSCPAAARSVVAARLVGDWS